MALLDHRLVERRELFPQRIAVDRLECRPVLNLSRNIGHSALSTFAVLALAHKCRDWILPRTQEKYLPSAVTLEPPRASTAPK